MLVQGRPLGKTSTDMAVMMASESVRGTCDLAKYTLLKEVGLPISDGFLTKTDFFSDMSCLMTCLQFFHTSIDSFLSLFQPNSNLFSRQ